MPDRRFRLSRPATRMTLPFLAACVLALAGCSYIPWLGGDKDPHPPAKLTDLTAEATLNPVWSERPTKGSQGRRLFLVPAVGGGRIYVADARGAVAAVDESSGRTLWQRDTKLPFSSGPDLEGDRLVLGTSSGLAVALATSDGHELWRAQMSGEILSVPRYSGAGQVVIHTLDGTIAALDGSKGTEIWRVSYPAPVLTLRGSGSPVAVQGGVLVGLAGGKLVKLDATDGAPLWESMITAPHGRSELARIADIDADPVVVGNTIFVGTYNGDLAAVDLATGSVQWRRQLSSHAGLAADSADLFVTDSEDRVWGADPVGGAGRWRQDRLKYRQLTAPALVGNAIAVGDLEGWVHLVARDNGRLLGRTRITKNPITARPVVSGGRVYVYAADGTLTALGVGTAGSRGSSNQPAESGERATIPSANPSGISGSPTGLRP